MGSINRKETWPDFAESKFFRNATNNLNFMQEILVAVEKEEFKFKEFLETRDLEGENTERMIINFVGLYHAC